jgi:hypothetical protein
MKGRLGCTQRKSQVGKGHAAHSATKSVGKVKGSRFRDIDGGKIY